MRVRIVFLGPIAARRRPLELDLNAERIGVARLMQSLAPHIPDALMPGGRPRPGILVFINGRDYRVYEEDDQLEGDVLVEVIQVFHGG